MLQVINLQVYMRILRVYMRNRYLLLTNQNYDLINRTGNSSREQYIRTYVHAGNPYHLHLQEINHQKITKKWPKIMHFSNTFENIYQTETLRGLKLGYPQWTRPSVSGLYWLLSISEVF